MGNLRSGNRRKGRSAPMGGAGFDLGAAALGGALLGIWVDRKFSTGPWGVVIVTSLAVVGGLINFVRAAKRAMERAARDPRAADEEQ